MAKIHAKPLILIKGVEFSGLAIRQNSVESRLFRILELHHGTRM
jgi:hypothetical protein